MLSGIAIADLFMQVTEVDAGMLQYQSLEDLTLTGNLLKTVRGEHLPPQLKVGSHGSSTCGKESVVNYGVLLRSVLRGQKVHTLYMRAMERHVRSNLSIPIGQLVS